MKMCCSQCHKEYMPNDKVALNEVNSILHYDCGDDESFPIKDVGTFEEIIKKYSFFRNSLLK